MAVALYKGTGMREKPSRYPRCRKVGNLFNYQAGGPGYKNAQSKTRKRKMEIQFHVGEVRAKRKK